MTRARAIFRCLLVGHRWHVTSRAASYEPRYVCARCGMPRWAVDAPLTPHEIKLGLVTLGCVVAGVVLAVLTAGGAW